MSTGNTPGTQGEMDAIVAACQRGERRAQRTFFEWFKSKMFVVCLRYAGTREEAEDLLQEGFVKVFRDLPQFRKEGSLEGWVRRVIVNVALQHIRRQKNVFQTTELTGQEDYGEIDEPVFGEEQTTAGLVKLMQELPTGFRTVLNLYVLEGYTHPEISQMLGISVGTSKSQLMRAKEHFRKLLEKHLVR